MYKIGLTVLALLTATPALAEREVFTLKQLTPQVKTYLQRGWSDNVQRCFFGEIEDLNDSNGKWKIIADDVKGSLTAINATKQTYFSCNTKGFEEMPSGSPKVFVPHEKMWYNVDPA